MKKPELLAPAGDFEKLKVAFHYGADAVYTGLKDFSLRANASNLDSDLLEEAIAYTCSLGKKIYVAMNVYFTPDESERFISQLKRVEQAKPDGVIVSDTGALYLAKEYAPSVPVHLSTQANTTNQYAVKLYQSLGVKRIILARELNLDHIKMIREACPDVELESFIHGAMCISWSGRCLLSSYMTHPAMGRRKNDKSTLVRSANKGDCSHSCRWEFILKEKTRPDQNYEITEDDEGTSVLSSKDINMVHHIGDMIEAGLDSFKIEGRMKSILYVSSIVRAYRQAIDHYFDPAVPFDKSLINEELDVVSHREFSTGYFYDRPDENAQVTGSVEYQRELRLAALVTSVDQDGKAVLKVYNTMTVQDEFQYITRGLTTIRISRCELFDEKNSAVSRIIHDRISRANFYDEKGIRIIPEVFDIIRMKSAF